jgi:hypothetical protein
VTFAYRGQQTDMPWPVRTGAAMQLTSSAQCPIGADWVLDSAQTPTGTPFPQPMSDGPGLGGLHHERPSGLAAATNDAAWMREDMPMLLHVFEHITRHAILGWWDSCQETAKQPESPPDGRLASDVQPP